MGNEHSIVDQVYVAKEDPAAADQFIQAYMPFIRSETAKFLKRPPMDGHDDELSIAMMAFYEAIMGYAAARGSFLKYASLLIRNRLIDFQRKEKRHRGSISLDSPDGESNRSLGDTIVDEEDHSETLVIQEGTRAEIDELRGKLEAFGISLSDVADHCPRQKRTQIVCQSVLKYAAEHPELTSELLRTKRLPVARLIEQKGIERKTLERHRKYIIALLLIYSNGFEIIRGHLKQVWKGETAQ